MQQSIVIICIATATQLGLGRVIIPVIIPFIGSLDPALCPCSKY